MKMRLTPNRFLLLGLTLCQVLLSSKINSLKSAPPPISSYLNQKETTSPFTSLKKQKILNGAVEQNLPDPFILPSKFNPKNFPGAAQKYRHQFRSLFPPHALLDDFQVNENIGRCDHLSPAIAVAGDGRFVVVWQDERDFYTDVYAQRFQADGTAVGKSFKVNEALNTEHYVPAIGIDNQGNFIVVWQDYRQGDADIFGQRFDWAGNKLGFNFRVNDDTGQAAQANPKIAVNAGGNFIVVWVDQRNGETNSDIYGQRFHPDGTTVGNNFQIDEPPNTIQIMPDVALNDSGVFVVVWQDYRNANFEPDIYYQFFDQTGLPINTNQQVNDDTNFQKQQAPVVALNQTGQFVIAWQDFRNNQADIFAQYFAKNRLRQGNNFKVNDDQGFNDQESPDVVVDKQGYFIIVWADRRKLFFDIYAQGFQNNGDSLGNNFLINDAADNFHQLAPVIGMSDAGDFCVSWRDQRHGNYDIYGQRFQSNATRVNRNFRINDDEGSSLQFEPVLGVAERGQFVVSWLDTRNGNVDVYFQRFEKNGAPQGTNSLVNDDGGTGDQSELALSVNSSGAFALAWCDKRNGNYDIYCQLYRADGQGLGGNFKVNTDVGTAAQSAPTIIMTEQGNLMLAWEDLRQGSRDIFGQLFEVGGIPIDNNFQVNETSGRNDCQTPTMAAHTNGNFIIVWQDDRNGDADIWAQLFDSNGRLAGPNFRVNTDGGQANQLAPAVDVIPDGDFLVVWQDERNENADIYGQQLSASGETVLDNFLISEDSAQWAQRHPAVSIDENGNFVVVWEDGRNDLFDIYGQAFDRNGRRSRANYRVNHDPGFCYQGLPAIKLRQQRIYYVWEDTRVPGQSYDVFARIDELNLAPPQPDLISLENNQFTNNATPTFVFTVPPDPERDPLHFKVEISRSNQPGAEIVETIESRHDPRGFVPPPPVTTDIEIMQFTLQHPLPDGIWYWRVAAFDGQGYSAPSVWWKFLIDTTPPEIISVKLLEPAYQHNWYNPHLSQELTFEIHFKDFTPHVVNITASGLNEKIPLEDTLRSDNLWTVRKSTDLSAFPDGAHIFHIEVVDRVNNRAAVDSVNYFDGTAPLGAVASSIDTSHSLTFPVLWGGTATDDSGSGLSGAYDLQVRTLTGLWAPWVSQFVGDSILFTGEHGEHYFFEVAAWDNVGNREAFTGTAETSTYVDTTQIEPEPPFQLSVTPDSQAIRAGETAYYTFRLESAIEFNQLVRLTLTNSPVGISWHFDPPELSRETSSTLVIQTPTNLKSARYRLTVSGMTEDFSQQVDFVLIIQERPGGISSNVITPNADGYNDHIIFNFPGIFESGSIMIFNARGQVVKQLARQSQWFGDDESGRTLPPGAYLYIVKIDGHIRDKGAITVVR